MPFNSLRCSRAPSDPIVPCLAAACAPLLPPVLHGVMGKSGEGQAQPNLPLDDSWQLGCSPVSAHSRGTGWEDVASWERLTPRRRPADNTFTAGVRD